MGDFYIVHSIFGGDRKNHKYFNKVKTQDNKVRYFYSKEEWDAYVSSAKDNVKKATDKSNELLTKGLDKLSDTINKVEAKYDSVTKDNEYVMDSSNYDEKIKKVAQTKEWQDIVKRKDPEYCVKQSDGTYKYLIDEYVAKKKHPVLDAVDDFVNYRKITVNKIDDKALIAVGDDQIKRYLGYAAIGTKLMLRGSQVRAGGYDDEINAVREEIKTSTETAKAAQKVANQYANTSVSQQEIDAKIRQLAKDYNISEKDAENLYYSLIKNIK